MTRADGLDTRARLMRAATLLMAEHGIEGVEFKDIQQAAGTRNRSAVQYYFGSRDGLTQAIGAEHREATNTRRTEILDRLEQGGDVSVSTLADAWVEPLAVELASEVGRAYLIVLAEAAMRMGTIDLTAPERTHVDSVMRVVRLMVPLLPGSPAERRRAVGSAMLTAVVLLADLARQINRGQVTLRASRRRVREISTTLTRSLGTV
jgi:AcrR family transcriptional regulator